MVQYNVMSRLLISIVQRWCLLEDD